MKSLIQAVVIVTACAAPLAAFAQSSDQGLTRDQVRAQLVEFQQTQRNQNIGTTAVNAPVAQGDSSYGGVSSSSSMAGARYVSEAARSGSQSVYFGGQ